jgi:acyl carrier protein
MKLEAKIKDMLSNLLGISLSDIDANSTKGSLGMDSLDDVEFIMCLEEEFDIEISDDEAEKIVSIQDAAELVESIRNGNT